MREDHYDLVGILPDNPPIQNQIHGGARSLTPASDALTKLREMAAKAPMPQPIAIKLPYHPDPFKLPVQPPAAERAPGENPKTGAGRLKPEPHLMSPIARLWILAAMENGAHKYGPYNWRDQPIPTNTYLSAMQRHIDEYATGVDRADDSKIPHLAHIAASAIILLDAEAHGSLIDDRFKIDGYQDVLKQIMALKKEWNETIPKAK